MKISNLRWGRLIDHFHFYNKILLMKGLNLQIKLFEAPLISTHLIPHQKLNLGIDKSESKKDVNSSKL